MKKSLVLIFSIIVSLSISAASIAASKAEQKVQATPKVEQKDLLPAVQAAAPKAEQQGTVSMREMWDLEKQRGLDLDGDGVVGQPIPSTGLSDAVGKPSIGVPPEPEVSNTENENFQGSLSIWDLEERYFTDIDGDGVIGKPIILSTGEYSADSTSTGDGNEGKTPKTSRSATRIAAAPILVERQNAHDKVLLTFREAIEKNGLEAPGGLAGNKPTYLPDVAMNLVLELEINRNIELRELVELHGGEHDLLGEVFFDEILADIDQIINDIEKMHQAGFVHQSSMSMGAFADNLTRSRKSLNDGAKFQEIFTGESLKEYRERLKKFSQTNNDDDDPPTTPDSNEEEEASGEEEEEARGGDDDSDEEEGDLWWDPRWGDSDNLIDLIDQAYNPVMFGLAIQQLLETTGLEGIRIMLDNQLEALEQFNIGGE